MKILKTQISYALIFYNSVKFKEFFNIVLNDFTNDYEIKTILEKIKINFEDLENILIENKEKINKIIQEDIKIAKNLKIKGVPSFYINNKLYSGELDFEDFDKILK